MFVISQGVTTAVGAHTLLLGPFYPMEHHRSWSLSEFNFSEVALYCQVSSFLLTALWLSGWRRWKCFFFFLLLPSPRPGSLKRGMASLMEESIMKRSRTSSISSGSGAHAPRGTPGTGRNPIHSSYSSTLGLSQVTPTHYSTVHMSLQRWSWSCWPLPPCLPSQRKKRSAPSSPLSSPGSSRSQTPDGASKRQRYICAGFLLVLHI